MGSRLLRVTGVGFERRDNLPDPEPGTITATLTVTAGDGEVVLDWSGSGGTGPYTADIHRDTSPGFTPGPSNRIAAGETDGSYTDEDVSNGTTYYYVAIVTDSLGATGTSEEQEAAPWGLDVLASRVGVWDSLAGLYQLADGTTPATTAGQSVGSWMSLDGADHLLTSTVGTNNPTLAITGTTPVVYFSGGASSTTRTRLQKNLTSTSPTAFTVHYLTQMQNASSGIVMGFTSTGSGTFFVNRSSGTNEARLSDGSVTRDLQPFLHWERWVHVTWVRSGANVKLFVDGYPIYSRTDGPNAWTRNAIVLGGMYGIAETVQRMAHASVFDAAQTDEEVLSYFNWLRNRFPELIGVPGDLIVFHGSSSVMGAHLGPIFQDHMLARGAWLTLDAPRPQFLVSGSQSGSTMQTLSGNFDTFVKPHLLRATGKRVLAVVGAASNSIVVGGLTPAQAYSDLTAYCTAAKAAVPNLKIVVQTVTPRSGLDNGHRATLNTLIRNGAGVDGFDYVADVASDATIGIDGANTNTTYYLGDQTHLNHQGNQVADNYYEAPFEAALA